MIIIVHSANLFKLQGSMNYFFSYGQMGAQLFFVLSAYALCVSWSKHREDNEALKNYYLKRVKRIVPSYWFMILLYALISYLTIDVFHVNCPLPIDRNPLDILFNALLLHGLIPSAKANNLVVMGGWYVGTAAIFYVLFPAIYSLYYKLYKKDKRFICVLTIVVFLLVLGIRVLLENNNNFLYYSGNNSYIYYSFINQLPVFCVGIELYFDIQKKALRRQVALCLFVLCTAVSLYLFKYNTAVVFTVIPFVSALSFYGLFIFVNSFTIKDGNKLVGILRSFGEHSYSLYLVQPLVIFWAEFELINRIPSGVSNVGLFFLLLIPVFIITYFLGRLLEKIIAICFQLVEKVRIAQ